MMQKAVRFIHKEPVIWGPIFLLCTLALAFKIAIPFDLLLLSAGGFFLSARLQMRGCCYALALLGVISVFRHLFLVDDHLWQLGLEGSLATAFLITALAFEQGSSWIHSLESQIQIRKSALQNLEEELSKVQQDAQDQQIIFQEKVASLQKELEEIQTEHSSILILNEVLRKTSARLAEEAKHSASQVHDSQHEIEQLRNEYQLCEEELTRLKNSDAVVIQNSQLMKELNQARFDKEQTHLINETLARLHLREILKAKDAEKEAVSLKEMLQAAHQEIRTLAEPLKEQILQTKWENEGLRFEFEKANEESNKVRSELLKLREIQAERNFLKERLDSAMSEIALKKTEVDPQLHEKLKFAEERMFHLSQIEPLFKQLKKQFKEKNQVLHQARSDLFKSDTELQKLRMEKSAIELNPIPKEIEEELESLAFQVEALEEENGMLQELITALSEPQERKKKVKMQHPSADQTFLF